MTVSRNLALLPAFSILIVTSLFHLLVAPYTKVEESFTLHAVWDILTHRSHLSKYDHWEFPGAVKRSFIPPFLLAFTTYPFTLIPEVNTQFAIRLALLLLSQLHFYKFAKKVQGLYGTTTANFFLLFTASQFHLPFYMSRTLPNFLALPVVTIALAQLLAADTTTTNTKAPAQRLQIGTGLLVAAGIIARSEIAMLCATLVFTDIILSPSPKRYIMTVLPAIVLSATVSTAATVTVDTHLWSTPSFPELEGLLFNVLKGHASEWGVEPWNYYLLSVPKLLLNPLSIPLILSTIVFTRYTSLSVMETIRKLRYILIAPILYVAGFSLLSHKEWRFIIYIIPLLTTASSISAAYIHHHRSKSFLYRLLHFILLLSIPVSLFASLSMSLISATNYPGALALDSLHTLSNSTSAKVYLDIPTRMAGVTLPLCSREGWTYVKSENTTILESEEYWKDIDYAIVGSLKDVPCKLGKGVEGKGEWECIYRQKGYAGIQWQDHLPDVLLENTVVRKVLKSTIARRVMENTVVQKVMDRAQGKFPLEKIMKVMKERAKVPWVKLEDKIFVLRHLRSQDFVERSIAMEETKEKERAGIGKMGEVEGQWRDFY